MAELLAELGYPISGTEAANRLQRGAETVFVAASGPRLLGLIAVSSQLAIARAGPLARVTAMVVREDARQRGHGRLLMERAVEWAAEAGCEGIELTSGLRPEREGAHVFYERFGFSRTSFRFWLPLPPPGRE